MHLFNDFVSKDFATSDTCWHVLVLGRGHTRWHVSHCQFFFAVLQSHSRHDAVPLLCTRPKQEQRRARQVLLLQGTFIKLQDAQLAHGHQLHDLEGRLL